MSSNHAWPRELGVFQEFAAETRPFRLLYDEVTELMQLQSEGLEGKERLWFESLIQGFQTEYEAWPKKPHVIRYLIRLRGSWQLLRVMAHTFLHIAYDLPRVIADSLRPQSVERHRAA